MSFSSPEQRQALCNSLAGPFRNIRSANGIDTPMIISILSVIITPAVIRSLVLGVACCVVPRQKPINSVLCQRCQQYELLPVEDSNDPLPSYSETQSSSSASTQAPGGIASAAVTAASSSKPSQIKDAGNPEGTDDAKPPPSTRTCKNYIILTICTILAIVDLMALLVIGFGFQMYLYCTPLENSDGTTIDSHQNMVMAIMLWITYAFIVAWVSSDIVCWWLMVKDLWYGQAQPGPRQNGDEHGRTLIGLMIYFGAFIVPLMFIVLILFALFIAPLRQCWLRLRGRRQRSELLETGDTIQSI